MKTTIAAVIVGLVMQVGFVSGAFADRSGICSDELTQPTCEGTYQIGKIDMEHLKAKKYHCKWTNGACHKE